MATLRIYCGKSNENCQFGITLRIEPESFWILGESYDPFKMGHTHELVLTPQPIKPPAVVDEERIDTDNDSYGDEADAFNDQDPLA